MGILRILQEGGGGRRRGDSVGGNGIYNLHGGNIFRNVGRGFGGGVKKYSRLYVVLYCTISDK